MDAGPATVQLTLRVPRDIAEELKILAREERRTVNAQAVYMLERSLEEAQAALGEDEPEGR